MKTHALNGKWNMTRLKTGETYPVSVPADNYTSLYELGVIPDPFYRDNENTIEWIGREDWSFTKDFEMTEEDLSFSRVLLRAKALDTLAEVYVNGILVGNACNAHLLHEFDVKQVLSVGRNTVYVKFSAPTAYAESMQKASPLPKNFNGTDGISYIRKPHCHFGWDWGPHLPLSGITGDIEILCFDNLLVDVNVEQIHEHGKVTVKANAEIYGNGEADIELICPDGEILDFVDGQVVVETPKLWWTRELGGKDGQPLYTVVATLDDQRLEKRIGLRTIKLDRSADSHGSNFCFYLNGVPIFSKGANWILPDSLMGRVTDDTYDKYIDYAIEANFNTIRVWGGAYYGSDYFYNRCDEKGILVWQDFMFACLMYPFYDKNFEMNVLDEVRYNVKRIKSHPSLALWCGNNEVEEMFAYLPEGSRLVKAYDKFFYHTLKDLVGELDCTTPYIPTSPTGDGFRKGVTSVSKGDVHFWTVWHGQKPLNYYRKKMARFCSEFGMESLPSMDAICQFAGEGDLDITSDVFNSHQKCKNGNRKMLYYMYEKFYHPDKFEDLIYFTQLTAGECISDATEHWRRNREVCHGSLFWQFNDCWQAPSWSSVDYAGKWKALQYMARHFFEPLMVSIEEKGRDYKIFAVNDLAESKSVKVEISLKTLDGKDVFTVYVDRALPPLSSQCIFEGKVKENLKDVFMSVKMSEGENLVSVRTKIFVADRDLNLKKCEIEKTAKYEGGELKIILSSPVYCRRVMLDIEGESTPFSDNCFDLIPGENKTVALKTDREYKLEDVKVKCLNNIPVQKSKFKNWVYRTKFFLEPMNFAQWIFYSTK